MDTIHTCRTKYVAKTACNDTIPHTAPTHKNNSNIHRTYNRQNIQTYLGDELLPAVLRLGHLHLLAGQAVLVLDTLHLLALLLDLL